MFDLKTLIIAVVAALLFGMSSSGYVAWQVRSAKADLALLDLRSTYDRASAKAAEDTRSLEHSLQEKLAKLGNKAREEDLEIDQRVAGVVAGTDSLLQAAAHKRLSADSCDPGVARRGAAATSAAYLYSQLLGASQRLAEGLAEEADRARKSGVSCEVAYDLVRKGLKDIAKGPGLAGG